MGVEPVEDQHLRAREQSGVELEDELTDVDVSRQLTATESTENLMLWVSVAAIVSTAPFMPGEWITPDPFALAIFIWLVMEGFARAIRKPFPNIPDWIAHLFAITVVVIDAPSRSWQRSAMNVWSILIVVIGSRLR